MKTLQEKIYRVFLDWRKGDEETRKFYEDHIVTLITEEEGMKNADNYFTYWETLKSSYKKEDGLLVNENIQNEKHYNEILREMKYKR